MKMLLSLFLVFVPSILIAQQENGCNVMPDKLEIVDDGPSKAIVTYYNSIEQCSVNKNFTLVSEQGIEVLVMIRIAVPELGTKEQIILIPKDGQYMSYPSEDSLFDGETKSFIVAAGVS